MKKLIIMLVVCLMAVSYVQAAKKMDIKSVTSGEFAAQSVHGIDPLPGTDQYALGSPLFKQATLTFENGKKLTIEAADNSCCTPYVESLSVNNKVYDRNYITHKVLTEGGKLDFKMSGTPNQKRGTTKSAFPYSFSDDKR